MKRTYARCAEDVPASGEDNPSMRTNEQQQTKDAQQTKAGQQEQINYEIECHENLVETVQISNWQNHTHLLNKTKYDFFHTVLSGLSRHRQGNKRKGVTLVRMSCVGLQIWRVMVLMGVRKEACSETLLKHIENVNMVEFAMKLMSVLQAFLLWTNTPPKAGVLVDASLLETLSQKRESGSETATKKRISCISTSVQTEDQDFWPLHVEEEVILPPPEKENHSMLLHFLDDSIVPCTSCMAVMKKQMLEMHSDMHLITEKYKAAMMDNEKLNDRLEQIMKENSDLLKRNQELEMHLKQNETSEAMSIACDEMVHDLPEMPDFMEWPEADDALNIFQDWVC